MDSFFDFIFANFFLVIIIIAAIINFLNRGRQEEKEQKRVPNRREQSPRRSIPDVANRKLPQQTKDTLQNAGKAAEDVKKSTVKTIEEQRKEQFERLRSRYQAREQTESEYGTKLNQELENKIIQREKQEQKEKLHVDLNKRLTRKGLMESVIMAEVLGPPRALKPYQNIASRRKNR